MFSKKSKYKFLIVTIILLASAASFTMFGQDASLKLKYSFSDSGENVVDESGNSYHGLLKNGAKAEVIGRFHVLNLGAQKGYIDLTANTGKLIRSLTNFTASIYVYVDPSVNLSDNGNFIWTFANSDDMARTANGNMFLSAKNTRYAISKTHWQNETSVSLNAELDKGKWKHITYVQDGTFGKLYVNGLQQKTNQVLTKPSDLGETAFNFIGRSCYASDVYLHNSYVSDFRIYNRALSTAEITKLSAESEGLDSAINQMFVEKALAELVVQGLDSVTTNLNLPLTYSNEVTITWQSANQNMITNSGIVNRPPAGSPPVLVELTAIFTRNNISFSKEYTAIVIPYLSNYESIITDSLNLSLAGNLNLLRSDLVLPISGNEGSVISWCSSNSSVLSDSGKIVSRPAHGQGNAEIQLTALIKKGDVETTKIFTIIVAEDEGFTGYLFSYFTGNSGDQESIRFALSDDGYTYRALNHNNPIIPSSEISSTGGVRDPHILRGENNDYYMVVTDMVSAWGWSSNRAMVLLKSANLVDWQSSVVNISTAFPEYAAADRIWAPQTIYDSSVGKYMVYFSMRLGPNDYDKIYYAYANEDFTSLESAPEILFDNQGKSVIDGDIVFFDEKYQLFLKTEGSGNGIKKAVSENLTSGYVLVDKYLQATNAPVEGSCVFRMYNSDKWMLIYDMYTSGSYQFTESFDLMNFSVSSTPSFDFYPRHGTIIPITEVEKNILKAKWKGTNLDKVGKTPLFSVYPNPASDFIIIDSKINDDNAQIIIKDLTGKSVARKPISSIKEIISIDNLVNGLYLISLMSNNIEIYTEKLVISKR